MGDPSTNGGNGGRDARGRFVKGNGGGPGNPKARDVARMRDVFRSACSDADILTLARKLIAMGKRGNIFAMREVLDRVLGKSSVVLESTEGGRSVLPIIEVLVENRDEFVEFNQIRDSMLSQIRQRREGTPLVGLPEPKDDRDERASAETEVD